MAILSLNKVTSGTRQTGLYDSQYTPQSDKLYANPLFASLGFDLQNVKRIRLWTPDAEAMLVDAFYQGYTLSQMEKEFNRTIPDIYGRITTLYLEGRLDSEAWGRDAEGKIEGELWDDKAAESVVFFGDTGKRTKRG